MTELELLRGQVARSHASLSHIMEHLRPVEVPLSVISKVRRHVKDGLRAGEKEATVIKSAVAQAKAHEYDLQADQQSIHRQIVDYEAACRVTNSAVEDMEKKVQK